MPDYAARRTMMVDTQVRPSDVTKFPIIAALLEVEKEAFVPAALTEAAYVGENLGVAPGRVMLEPRTFAKMLDALDIQQGELVLDVGCAHGYSTAVIARLCEAVVAVEEMDGVAIKAQALLAAKGADNAHVVAGPLIMGAAKHGPYDVIVIEGAVEQVPQALLDQLKDGGRIGCLFMEAALGLCRVGYKHDGAVTWRYAFNAGAPVMPGFALAREFTL
jgi:protein-L-isoaspartate(D-aspartate) O-methyltransferase